MKWIIKIKTLTGLHVRHSTGNPAEIEQDIALEFGDENYGITTIQVLP
jgi:hypothetical protein